MPLSRTVLPSADVENKSTTYVCTSLCSLAAAGSLKFLSLKTSPEQNSSAWETRPALQATDKSAADHGRTRRASSQSSLNGIGAPALHGSRYQQRMRDVELRSQSTAWFILVPPESQCGWRVIG